MDINSNNHPSTISQQQTQRQVFPLYIFNNKSGEHGVTTSATMGKEKTFSARYTLSFSFLFRFQFHFPAGKPNEHELQVRDTFGMAQIFSFVCLFVRGTLWCWMGGVVVWLELAGGIPVGDAGYINYGPRPKVGACADGGILFVVWWGVA
ncbi:hypothetical protein EYC80_000652 [Monilinia laxa]|uniref:Uncharacterized protein n=1 Tax=Monilinia laxa TaxID=61186 RepID=A0A5N6KBA1_MONLA|nr:hypothetical protein EYC80_000652 [Monilinia laxa]